jgi:hypothetical protein
VLTIDGEGKKEAGLGRKVAGLRGEVSEGKCSLGSRSLAGKKDMIHAVKVTGWWHDSMRAAEMGLLYYM